MLILLLSLVAIMAIGAIRMMAIVFAPVAAILGSDCSQFVPSATGSAIGVESDVEAGFPASGSDQFAIEEVLDRLVFVSFGSFFDGGSYGLLDAQLGDLLFRVNGRNASRYGLDLNHHDRTVVRKGLLNWVNLRPQFSQSNRHRLRYLALT